MRNAVTNSRDARPLGLHHNVRARGSESSKISLAPADFLTPSARAAACDVTAERRILSLVSAIKALWATAPSDDQAASIFCDAIQFAGALPGGVSMPRVWSDVGEVVFEWIENGQHAIVSCEGDGVIGYTFRVDGTFQPGAIEAAKPDVFPSDLTAYLTVG